MTARALTALLGFAGALTLVATPAQAADSIPPTLSVPVVSSFVVGQQVADPVDNDGSLVFFNGGAQKQFKWTATDASEICRYSVDEDHGVQGWTEGAVDYLSNATRGRYVYSVDEYENSDDLFNVRINAYDCAGNKSSVERPAGSVSVAQDYGSTVPDGWARTSCTCAIGDSMLRTSKARASLRTVVNAGGRAQRFALVMAKGPARGKAAIYFDGSYVKTIDTYAGVNTNRVVMWNKKITDSRDHTIKVVNRATPGRPRIDVDAYLR